MSLKNICKEHCIAYHPSVSEFTSVFDCEMCLKDCEELYSILKELANIVANRCEKEAMQSSESAREKVFKGCIGYYINMLISEKNLVEDLLKIVANEMNVEID